ncbi:MAG: hypothetical protein AAF266_10885 [Planctomycetota bacterium]
MSNTEPDELAARLAASHDVINGRHAGARQELLDAISTTERMSSSARPLPHWVLGGVGVSAACVVIALIGVALFPQPLSAMERMARAVEKVASFSWRMESEYTTTAGEGRRLQDTSVGRWQRDPRSLHGTIQVIETKRTNSDTPDEPSRVVDVEETHGPESGIVIDHRRRQYFLTPGMKGVVTPGNSPQAMIYKVRSRRGEVLEHLGERTIGGRTACGVRILLDDADPETEAGPAEPESIEGQRLGWDGRNVTVEAWYDPETDLPIEFSLTRQGEDFTTSYRYSDLRWNVEFDAEDFAPKTPPGYTEVESPTD